MTRKEFEALLQKFRYAVYDYASAQGEADGQAQAEGEYHYFSADQSNADALEKQIIAAFDELEYENKDMQGMLEDIDRRLAKLTD